MGASNNLIASGEREQVKDDQIIKPLLRRIADLVIVPPVRYIRSKSIAGPQHVATRLDVLSTMHNNAILDSANYADSHMGSAMAFEDKQAMWTYVVGLCHSEGLCAEF